MEIPDRGGRRYCEQMMENVKFFLNFFHKKQDSFSPVRHTQVGYYKRSQKHRMKAERKIAMTYPYDNNWNPQENTTQNNGWMSSPQSPVQQTPVQPTETPVQTAWDGSSYHSVPPVSFTPPTPRQKKKSGAGRTALKAVAAVMACVMISAGSIGVFTALVNNGTIKLGTSGSSSGIFDNGVSNAGDTDTQKVTNNSTELTLQQIAKKLIPSVVCIQNYQRAYQGGFGQSSGLQEAGEGSGIIATSDGYIITNAHVVDGASALKVVLSDGTTYDATLVGSDTATDLALLKIDAADLTAAEFGSSDDLQVADMVMAVGNPGGMAFQSSVTIGYVSALDRQMTDSNGYTQTFIQTDAAINPGNSGGALVNVYGQVVGINTAKISDEAYEGLGFAIPMDSAKPIIENLKENGSVARPMLGISGSYLNSLTARYYGLEEGMYIQSITNTALIQAGVQAGDVITSINGQAVTSSSTINAVIVSKNVGDTVDLEICRRGGSTFTVTVPLIQASNNA